MILDFSKTLVLIDFYNVLLLMSTSSVQGSALEDGIFLVREGCELTQQERSGSSMHYHGSP